MTKINVVFDKIIQDPSRKESTHETGKISASIKKVRHDEACSTPIVDQILLFRWTKDLKSVIVKSDCYQQNRLSG